MGFDDRGPATELDGLVGRMIRLEIPEVYKVLSHTSPKDLAAAMRLSAAKLADERRPAEPRVNEASLFDELKELAKAICNFAYENKFAEGLFFDVVAKDGGLFRVSVNLLRHDAYSDRKPIVVLEPRKPDDKWGEGKPCASDRHSPRWCYVHHGYCQSLQEDLKA